MPIYEYQCPECAHVFEEWVKSATDENADHHPCPSCQATASRMMSNTSFVLKGGGWYVTEYGNGAKNQEGQNSSANSAPASSGSDTGTAGTASSAETSASSSSANSSTASASASTSASTPKGESAGKQASAV